MRGEEKEERKGAVGGRFYREKSREVRGNLRRHRRFVAHDAGGILL